VGFLDALPSLYLTKNACETYTIFTIWVLFLTQVCRQMVNTFLTLWGTTGVKAVRRTLMKSSPGVGTFAKGSLVKLTPLHV